MKRWLRWMIPVLPLFVSACASTPKAKLVEWKNNDLTLCCTKSTCNDKDWNTGALKYCKGQVRMTGGKVMSGVSGYQSEGKKGDTIKLSPVVTEQSCRTFQCEGTVIPPQ